MEFIFSASVLYFNKVVLTGTVHVQVVLHVTCMRKSFVQHLNSFLMSIAALLIRQNRYWYYWAVSLTWT